MRSEEQMMDLILTTAESDARVRAVIMNGSRANPNAPRDIYQDYDIVYIVRDLASFTSNHAWIDRFGERVMLQMPETMRDPAGDGCFAYLMLFSDGNRIDLTLVPIEEYKARIENDSESILLLDKDGLLPPFPPPSDRDYWTKPPAKFEYDSCCNNFLWCMQNVAKGLARDEIPYVFRMLHTVVYEELHFMLDWTVGAQHNFAVTPGKLGKYYKRYLCAEDYAAYERVYSDARPAHIWDAVFAAMVLFGKAARRVGEHMGFCYNEQDDTNMTKYLQSVRASMEGE